MLKRAVLRGTVAGFRIGEMSAEDEQGVGAVSKADVAACGPVAGMVTMMLPVAPDAAEYRTLKPADKTQATVGSMWVGAHTEPDAKTAMKQLRQAVRACHGPFKAGGQADKSVKALSAPKLGDDALSYRLVGDLDGEAVPMAYTVVRVGGVTSSFYGMNLLDPTLSAIPQALVKVQVSEVTQAIR